MQRFSSGLALGFFLVACSSGSGTGGSGAAGGTSGSSGASGSGGSGAQGGSAGSGAQGGSSGSAGKAGSSGSGGSGGSPTSCPHVDLGSTVPANHGGDTTGLPHIAESSRLEWGDAPDDTLLFTAPEAGTYHITMTQPSTNGGCGASIQEYGDVGTTTYYDTSWCPSVSSVVTLDGVYAAGDGIVSDFAMAAGQQVMIWVSCTTWSDVQAGPYKLTITKL